MENAPHLREQVVSAVCSMEYYKLTGLIRKLSKYVTNEETLVQSGLGHLLGDRHLWALGGHEVQRRAQALQCQWRVALRHARSTPQLSSKRPKPPPPFGGLRAKPFLEVVKSIEKDMTSCLPTTTGPCRALLH